MLLSGPEVDPGFHGVLIVRVTNLAPKRITLAHQARFLTVQFFKGNMKSSTPTTGRAKGTLAFGPQTYATSVTLTAPRSEAWQGPSPRSPLRCRT